MKKISYTSFCIFFLSVMAMGTAYAADLKIGIVDYQMIMAQSIAAQEARTIFFQEIEESNNRLLEKQKQIQALQDEKWHVRQAAAWALGEIGPEEGVVPALIQALQDEDADVRQATARALGEIGPEEKEAVPALIQALEDEVWYVRWTAAQTLGKIGRK